MIRWTVCCAPNKNIFKNKTKRFLHSWLINPFYLRLKVVFHISKKFKRINVFVSKNRFWTKISKQRSLGGQNDLSNDKKNDENEKKTAWQTHASTNRTIRIASTSNSWYGFTLIKFLKSHSKYLQQSCDDNTFFFLCSSNCSK